MVKSRTSVSARCAWARDPASNTTPSASQRARLLLLITDAPSSGLVFRSGSGPTRIKGGDYTAKQSEYQEELRARPHAASWVWDQQGEGVDVSLEQRDRADDGC